MRNVVKHITLLSLFVLSGAASALAQAPPSPGKEHEELKAQEGKWDTMMSMPDGSEMKGSCEFKMTCEGMWLSSDFHSDFGGAKFHGRGLDSYDASKKQYVAIWVDSMSQSPMMMTGTKVGKVMTLVGEGPGPAGPMKYKSVTTHDSADKMTFKLFTVADGKDTEMLTIVYTRQK